MYIKYISNHKNKTTYGLLAALLIICKCPSKKGEKIEAGIIRNRKSD